MISHFSHLPPEGCENKMGMESWLFFTDMKGFVWSSLQTIFENSSSDYYLKEDFFFLLQNRLMSYFCLNKA